MGSASASAHRSRMFREVRANSTASVWPVSPAVSDCGTSVSGYALLRCRPHPLSAARISVCPEFPCSVLRTRPPARSARTGLGSSKACAWRNAPLERTRRGAAISAEPASRSCSAPFPKGSKPRHVGRRHVNDSLENCQEAKRKDEEEEKAPQKGWCGALYVVGNVYPPGLSIETRQTRPYDLHTNTAQQRQKFTHPFMLMYSSLENHSVSKDGRLGSACRQKRLCSWLRKKAAMPSAPLLWGE